MRLFTLLALFAYLFGGYKEKAEIFDNAIAPTVQTVSKSRQITGSGIVYKTIKIKEDLYYHIIISCEHTSSHKMQVKKFTYQNKKFITKEEGRPALLICSEKDADISLLLTISKEPWPLANVKKGAFSNLLDEVYSVGCGLGENPRYAEGKITGFYKSDKNVAAIRTSVPIVPGDSGCGLYTKKNELIGIANSIKKFAKEGADVAVEGISIFKPVDLIFSTFDKKTYEFATGTSQLPELFAEFLWMLDAEFAN